jgi:hypothetical protein
VTWGDFIDALWFAPHRYTTRAVRTIAQRTIPVAIARRIAPNGVVISGFMAMFLAEKMGDRRGFVSCRPSCCGIV